MKPRLWITGTGLVTALGPDRESTWEGIATGVSGIAPLRLFPAEGHRSQLAAEVRREFFLGAAHHAHSSRTSAMAASAVREALAEAQIHDLTRVGLVVGGTTSGMFETEELVGQLYAARDRLPPGVADADQVLRLVCHPLSSVVDALELEFGNFARVRSVASACSSGANAFVLASSWLLSGEVDAVVAGGSDGLSRLTYSGFSALGVMSPEPCRPFDRDRRGLTLGEGAGFVVLERSSRARQRGVSPKAELSGFAVRSEAHHVTNPEPSGEVVAETIARALRRAGLDPASIDYVNAHGTGTVQNDAMESRALVRALGRELDRILVSSSKGQIGHTLGASGAVEATITAIAIARQLIPPHVGALSIDPDLQVQLAPANGTPSRVRAAVSNSFGFGGMNTVLVLTEPEFGPPLGFRESHAVVTGVSVAIEGESRRNGELDADRSRRLSQAARLATIASIGAIRHAALDPADAGVVFGSAFGSLDGCGAYLERLATRGPRFTSPADFPNLVPSAVAGHVSIYLTCKGPTMVTADLMHSDLAALFTAGDMVECGEADAIIAGGVASKSVLLPAMEPLASDGEPPDVAVAIVVEDEARARARGATVQATIAQKLEWRGSAVGRVGGLVAPRGRSEVVWARGSMECARDLLRDAGWADVPITDVAAAPPGETRFAFLLAEAAVRLGQGSVDSILMIACTDGGGYAVVLQAP